MIENLIVNNNEFRIKKMNAIEVLALQTVFDVDDYSKTLKCFETILEKIEVKIGEQWVTVKDGNNYYPVDIENNIEVIKELVAYFMRYMKEVFI